jgi:glycosyltransferase involved in cell wall biosynthesis
MFLTRLHTDVRPGVVLAEGDVRYSLPIEEFHLRLEQGHAGKPQPYLPRMSQTVGCVHRCRRDEIRQAMDTRRDRSALCGKYGLPENKYFVVSMGRVTEEKGCFILLDAAMRIGRADPTVFFVWIGDGPARGQMESLIGENGLKECFRLIAPSQIGPERLDLLELVRLADCFVHPSFREGLPAAVLEAMALGKACVASRINAIPEAITDRETGILVPPGDGEALSEAIAELCGDSALRERLGAAGQSHVLANFDESIAAQTTAEYYRTCLRNA